MVGRRLGHYLVVEPIGAGGMGVVYRARDERLERDVALKVLPEGALSEPDARKRFRHEALALSHLNHPNIATIHDFDTQDGVDFLVMEYIPGITLSDKLTGGALAEQETLRLGVQLAAGIAAAHDEGLMHADLKPGNIRITPDARVKILDFGLARLFAPVSAVAETVSAGEAVDESSGILGTLPYMAPEQLRGGLADARADIYAAGVVLYEMANGRRPFPQKRGPQLVAAILEQPPRPLDRRLSAALAAILMKTLDKDPERRYQSARELGVDLERARTGAAPPPRARRVALAWAAAAVLLMALVVAALVPGVRQALRRSLAPVAMSEPKVVAVLPFQAIGGGGGDLQAYADGLTETLTARLAQFTAARRLQVAASSEVRAVRPASVEQARKQLGVNLAFTGSLTFAGDSIRVNYSLVDAATQRQLGADSLTGVRADPFALQDRVFAGVARMLDLEWKPAAPVGRGVQVAGAYDFYLVGRGYLQSYDKLESIDNAIGVFERALTLDQALAPAHAGLGEAYWRKHERTKDPQWLDAARRSCQQARQLDASLAAARICLGNLANTTGEYAQAAAEFARALEQEPANDDAWRGLARAQHRLGRVEEAEKTYRRAIDLRPHYWAGYNLLGGFLIGESRYQEAARQFEQAVALTPDNATAHTNLGAAYMYMENYAEAIRTFQKQIQLRPVYQAYYNLGNAYMRLRRFQESVGALEQALQINSQDYRVPGFLARCYYWSPGRRAEARDMFERAIHLGAAQIKINPKNADAHANMALYHAMLGRRAEAFRCLGRALTLHPDEAEILAFAAVVHNQFGDTAAALAWIEKAAARGYTPGKIATHIELDNLRDQPRFQALLGQSPIIRRNSP